LEQTEVAIIGAGPAGLTAAYELTKSNIPVIVFESDQQTVGGISRTVNYKGYLFDIGGHRFFSKSQEIEALWSEILPHDLLERPRSSKIYYRKRFFSYPLNATEALRKLGVLEAARCALSFLKARLLPIRPEHSFADWVSNRFGERLFSIFFKSYTEKVWGMSCSEISADWAAQRIKGLSLSSAIWSALRPQRSASRGQAIKSLINSFRYPRLGPGMLWEACAQRIRAGSGQVRLGRRVVRCTYETDGSSWIVETQDRSGKRFLIKARHLISSAPLRELCGFLSPSLQKSARVAAESLRYRDFITVALMVNRSTEREDQWIYIHDPEVRVGRIQNFSAWSPAMVPEVGKACFGLEYFCYAHDGLWSLSDEQLIALARREFVQLGFAASEEIADACVVRQPKAYPVYDDGYRDAVAAIRRELEEKFPTLQVVGRNGMHKYNNQDHSMMTALLAARNIAAGNRSYDVWSVNEDAAYHEASETSRAESGLRAVPERLTVTEMRGRA
jgi:protoporphyrinogen oxidase